MATSATEWMVDNIGQSVGFSQREASDGELGLLSTGSLCPTNQWFSLFPVPGPELQLRIEPPFRSVMTLARVFIGDAHQ